LVFTSEEDPCKNLFWWNCRFSSLIKIYLFYRSLSTLTFGSGRKIIDILITRMKGKSTKKKREEDCALIALFPAVLLIDGLGWETLSRSRRKRELNEGSI
jgi:hypothetical protein